MCCVTYKPLLIDQARLSYSSDVQVNMNIAMCVLLLCVHTLHRSTNCELHPVSDKWLSLRVQLQVPIKTLRCIRRENLPMSERLLEMLTVWLRYTNPLPTWNILIEALESPPVGESLLAQQLRDK